MKTRASKSNEREGNDVKKSNEDERDLTTVRIQHDPVWKLNEEILCDWKGRGVFYTAEIVGITQYEDEPVYVVNYLYTDNDSDITMTATLEYLIECHCHSDVAVIIIVTVKIGNSGDSLSFQGFRHADEKVLQSEAFKRFLPITDENVQKVNHIFQNAKKMAEEKRKSKGSIARGGSIGRRSVAVAKDTPVRRGRLPGKSSTKRGRKSVKRSDSNSTASLIDSFMPDADLGAKRRKIGRQGDMNTSEGSVVPATPESESPEDAENTGILPKKLKEIFEMDRHRVETDFKLPVIPARFSVKNIINGLSTCSRKVVMKIKRDWMKPNELLRCFDDSTGKLQLAAPEYENPEGAKEATDESADGKVIEPPEFSSMLGLPYLLRLLENFSDVLLEREDWTLTDTNSSICIQHFVNYLMNSSDEFYQSFWTIRRHLFSTSSLFSKSEEDGGIPLYQNQ
uniref:MRG domain-containing protein n=1 Tax=Ditylenchus dipsaci TaxID=166011 RepID=A0A915EIX2_9BILA